MKFFNTAGPCKPDIHYMLPASTRLPELRGLIDQQAYFVIHAPRQGAAAGRRGRSARRR